MYLRISGNIAFILLILKIHHRHQMPLYPGTGHASETEDFGWLSSELLKIANGNAGGRLVSVLEGGYHLGALADAAQLHVQSLRDHAA